MPYERIRELGRGGFGTVWLARDTRLDRLAALKVLQGDDPDELARFQREATTAAGLSHPNIAAVYEVGEIDGQPFIALQYVEGETLAKRRLNPREALEAIRDAARAVAHAHERGVIHRDLKPQNIMAGDRIYVLDFGLARSTKAHSSLTLSGDILGTPAYMSPEQALGRRADERSDVYGLGATLYELVTGQMPFSGENPYDVVRQVVEQDPVSPRRLNPRLDRDIETIVLTAMDKDPARRYASAAAMADDADRALRGEPIAARPVGPLTRLVKRVRRQPAVSGLVALLALATVAAGGVWVRAWIRERGLEESRRAAEHAARTLDEAEDLLADPKVSVAVIRERVRELIERLAAGPQDAPLVLLTGRAYDLRGDDAAALAWYARAIDAGSTDRRVHVWRAQVNLEDLVIESQMPGSKRVKRLVELIHADLRQAREGTLEARQRELVELYEMLLDEHRFDELIERCRVRASAGGRTEELHLLIGLVEHRRGRWKECLPPLDAALERHPRLLFALLVRGIAHGNLNHHAQAVADLTQALELKPHNAGLWYNLGAAQANQRLYPDAVANFTRALELDSRLNVARIGRAVARAREGDRRAALKDFDAVIAEDPQDAAAHHYRGSVRFDLGDMPGAIADFTRVIEIEPTRANAYADRAEVKRRQGDPRAAIDDCTQALEMAPENPQAYFIRAEARFDLGDFPGAVDDYSLGLRHRPEFVPALAGRAMCRTGMGDFGGAVEDALRGTALDPQSVVAHSALGRALLNQGTFDRAVAAYDRAIELSPPRPDLYFNRGLARRGLGDAAGAREDLERALREAPEGWPHRALVEQELQTLRGSSDF